MVSWVVVRNNWVNIGVRVNYIYIIEVEQMDVSIGARLMRALCSVRLIIFALLSRSNLVLRSYLAPTPFWNSGIYSGL